MPTTRSASKKQKSLEDYGLDATVKSKTAADDSSPSQNDKSQDARRTNAALKRKSTAEDLGSAPKRAKSNLNTSKHAKQTQLSSDTVDLEQPILINRSPVLQLWAASVAGFLYPDEDWTTCLSIGGSVATLCAVSKGRAIGKIEPKDPSTKSEEKNKKGTREPKDDTRKLEVMGFPMQIKAGVVVADGKQKPVKEHLLQAKFGGEEVYTNVKRVMENALQQWTDDKEQLDKEAFHMYEKFRPSTAAGSAGWGRKGELNLHLVRSTIQLKD